MATLTKNSITFGKYKDQNISELLKDRKYCAWVKKNDWFKQQYPYLYNKIETYKPDEFFFSSLHEGLPFYMSYKYFNMQDYESFKSKIMFTEQELLTYNYYVCIMKTLQDKILLRIEDDEDNIYDIKMQSNWLSGFTYETQMDPKVFTSFISSFDLPSISKHIHSIKECGGKTHRSGDAFKIGKERSLIQEKFWENILVEKYKDIINSQYKYKTCIFDFLKIKDVDSDVGIIYECKLNMKDFVKEQYLKYRKILPDYKIVYLIDTDMIIHLDDKKLYVNKNTKFFKPVLNSTCFLTNFIVTENVEIIYIETLDISML